MKSCPRDNGVTLTQVPGSLEVYPKRGYRAVQIGRHVFARAGEPAAGSCGGQGFGDFFTSMFGRAAQPESPDARVERGRDEYFGLVIDASDAVDRAVNLRSLVPDAQGHRVVVMRQLQV
jgi:hypothetical protein